MKMMIDDDSIYQDLRGENEMINIHNIHIMQMNEDPTSRNPTLIAYGFFGHL